MKINKSLLNKNDILDFTKDIYSSSETLTNKFWNNKPIYRKVLTGTTGTGGSWAEISISSLNIDTITNLEYKFGTYEQYFSNFYISSNFQLTVRCLDNKIQYYYGAGYSNQDYTITIEYTKNN